MGRGRAPCCDKEKVKRGPWSPQEDIRLITFIQKYGHENWRALPKQSGLLRCGKSCRLRWINYLRPDVKRGNFTKEEEETIIRLHEALGNKWSKIASHLPGRTDNEIKNVWNTHLKKRLASKKDGFKELASMTSSSSSSSSCSIVTAVSTLSGKRNLEVELKQQWDVTKKPREEELSSSSVSSNNSNTMNSIAKDEAAGSLMSKLIGSEEVNKPEVLDDVPLESDLDFWNMLDSLASFKSDDGLNCGEGCSKKAENPKLLSYLENEIDFEVTRNENQSSLSKDGYEPLVPEMYDIQMVLKPELGEMGHSHI